MATQAAVNQVVKATRLGSVARSTLVVDGVAFDLYELSDRAISAFARAGEKVEPRQDVGWLVRTGDTPLCDGRGDVVSVRGTRNGTKIELVVRSAPIDVDRVTKASLSIDFLAQLERGVAHSDALVPSEYKAFCAQAGSALRAFRSSVAEAGRALTVGPSTRLPEDLFEAASARLIAHWNAMLSEGTQLVLPYLDVPVTLAAMRTMTQRLVTRELVAGAIFKRAVEKPRGYPGDYGVMQYAYDAADVGDDDWSRLAHRVGLDLCACIRGRKDVLRETLLQLMQSGRQVRATSIACGSAQEIYELAQTVELPGRLHVTLVDQDPEAIEFARSRIDDLQRRDGPVAVTGSSVHFSEYVNDSPAIPGEQDLVYCFGMYDYLPSPMVKQITESLYRKVRTGGRLVLGNIRAEAPVIWPSSFVVGYDMWFRSEREMHDLARHLPNAKVDLKLERSGNNYLLFVTKGA